MVGGNYRTNAPQNMWTRSLDYHSKKDNHLDNGVCNASSECSRRTHALAATLPSRFRARDPSDVYAPRHQQHAFESPTSPDQAPKKPVRLPLGASRHHNRSSSLDSTISSLSFASEMSFFTSKLSPVTSNGKIFDSPDPSSPRKPTRRLSNESFRSGNTFPVDVDVMGSSLEHERTSIPFVNYHSPGKAVKSDTSPRLVTHVDSFDCAVHPAGYLMVSSHFDGSFHGEPPLWQGEEGEEASMVDELTVAQHILRDALELDVSVLSHSMQPQVRHHRRSKSEPFYSRQPGTHEYRLLCNHQFLQGIDEIEESSTTNFQDSLSHLLSEAMRLSGHDEDIVSTAI